MPAGSENLKVSLTISARDAASAAVGRVIGTFRTMGTAVAGVSRTITSSLFSIQSLLATLAAGQAIRSSVNAFAEFEQAMAEVGTLVDDTAFRMDRMNDAVLAMSKQFGQVPTQTARALYNVVSAGSTDAAEAVTLLNESNKLAIAGISDVNTAFLALNAAMKPYKISVSDAAHASDLLFATVRAGKTTLPELSQNLNKVAPAAASAGLEIEQLMAAISTMTAQTSENTDTALSGLNSFLRRFRAAGTEAARLNKEFGLNLQINTRTLQERGLAGSIEAIRSEINKLDEDARDIALYKLFPDEALKGFLVLESSLERLRADTASIAGAAGAAQQAFEEMSKTVLFEFARTSSSLKNLLIQAGSALRPVVVELSSDFRTFFDAIAKFIKDNQDAFRLWFSEMLDGLKSALLAVGNFLLGIDQVARAVWDYLRVLFTKGIPGALEKFILAMGEAARRSASLVLAELAALAQEVISLFSGALRDSAKEGRLFAKAMTEGADVLDRFEKTLSRYHAALNMGASVGENFGEAMRGAWAALDPQVIARASDGTERQATATERLSSALREIVDNGRLTQFLAALRGMAEAAGAEDRALLDEMAAGLERMAAAMDRSAEAASRASSKWSDLFSKIGSSASNAASSWAGANQIISGAASATTSALDAVAGGFTNAFTSIIDGSKSASQAFKDFAKQIIAELVRIIVKMLVYAAVAAAVGFLFPGAGLFATGLAAGSAGGAAGAAGAGGGGLAAPPASLLSGPAPLAASASGQNLSSGAGGGGSQPVTVNNITINAIEPQTFAAYLATPEAQDKLKQSTQRFVASDPGVRNSLRRV